jgi:orotidine-5'-phosphate decarboxylase
MSEPSASRKSDHPVQSHFADRVISRVRDLGNPLCLGLDPHLDRIPTIFRRGDMALGAEETSHAVETYLLAILERAEGRVAVVKPQIAFFEQLGWRGIKTLERIVGSARELGFEVLLDAKRGDIGSTAEGYARAYLDSDSPILVDAITLNPYLGLDTLEPFAARATASGRGLFVLVKTSNPGSGDLQDRDLDGEPLYAAVATALAPLAEKLAGSQTGWSSLGVVVGGTYPGEASRVRERLPNALFLVPGYGSQGGLASEAVSGFVPGPNGLEGGLVNSSRGILFPDEARGADAQGWERAIDSALGRAIGDLSEAVLG